MIRNFIIILSFLLITSCSFSPMYENSGYMPFALGKVEIVNESNPKLYYLIRQEFHNNVNPQDLDELTKYSVNLKVLLSYKEFDTKTDSIKTRSMIISRIDFTVHNKEGNAVYNDFVTGIENYEITSSPFSSLVAKEESTKILLKSLISEVALKLGQL